MNLRGIINVAISTTAFILTGGTRMESASVGKTEVNTHEW